LADHAGVLHLIGHVPFVLNQANFKELETFSALEMSMALSWLFFKPHFGHALCFLSV
jgi:hypothetical protein